MLLLLWGRRVYRSGWRRCLCLRTVGVLLLLGIVSRVSIQRRRRRLCMREGRDGGRRILRKLGSCVSTEVDVFVVVHRSKLGACAVSVDLQRLRVCHHRFYKAPERNRVDQSSGVKKLPDKLR